MAVNFFLNGSSWIDCGTGASITDAAPFTISAWIYPFSRGAGSAGTIAYKGAGNYPWRFRMNQDVSAPNSIRFIKDHNTNNLDVESASNTIKLNQWNHVAVTWDGQSLGTGVKLYVAGTETTTYPFRQDGTGGKAGDSSATGNLSVGTQSGGTLSFEGYISELAIWGSAILSKNQILALATSRVKGLPLQIASTNGGLKLYLPLDDFADAMVVTGNNVIMDDGPFKNNGSIKAQATGTPPTAKAESILSYQPY